jgi:phytoene synthase
MSRAKAAPADPRALVPEAAQADLQALVIAKVRAAGSSFYWAMCLLEAPRRLAMYAIYAFCRDVDDIVDEPGADADKSRRLDLWRDDIAAIYAGRRPSQSLAQALVAPVAAYALPKEDFLAVIDGCAMDIGDGLVRPSLATLDLYCDRVAAAVGRLSVRVFGDASAAGFDVANHQGRALQLTNILRDVSVDAALGRLYLPDELLTAHGIGGRDVQAIIADPALPAVCRDLAVVAERHYAAARAAMARCSRRAMRPAAVMLEMYHAIYRRCAADGWRPRAQPVKVPKAAKIWCALRYGLFAS